jgi:peptide/nickel transport system permease protein
VAVPPSPTARLDGSAAPPLDRSVPAPGRAPQALVGSAAPAGRASWGLRRALRRSPWLTAGLAILLLIVASSVLAGVLAPYAPTRVFPGRSLEPPGATFLLGSDAIGRDVLSRLLFGSRISFAVAVPSVALALLWGTLLGLAAGYFGGWVDQAITRVLDVFFAFPGLLLAIALAAALGTSIQNLILIIAVVYTPRICRVVRAPVLSVKERDFVLAARAIGARDHRIVGLHVLPNITSPIVVEAALALARAMLTETGLSYLGLGPPPPNPSWGAMLSESRQFMEFAPWTVLAPGLAIMLAVMSFVLIGNGLRDRFDPRRRLL